MEYILFLTYRCNLNCAYCFAKNLVHNKDTKNFTVSPSRVNEICEYIKKDIHVNHREDNSIVFFGGEPSLVPDIIMNIMEKTGDLKIRYSIYTNGLLLNDLPDELLKKLSSILVAIDGDRKTHVMYKPAESYDAILWNVAKIKPKTQAQIIARITMEETTDIYASVMNLVDSFDYVHWQIVNKDCFIDPEKMKKNYRKGIERLFDQWLRSLKNGEVINIIPINRIVLSFINPRREQSFRCGCGSSIQAIDVAGNIYACDECVGSKENVVGTIRDGKVDLIKYKKHTDLFEDCKSCTISNICLGRCRKLLESQRLEHIRIYCEMTKILVGTVFQSIDEIKTVITKQGIDTSLLCSETYHTEIIP